MTFPHGFLWGAATAAHQVEGNNVNSDWWALEQAPETFVTEPSGDAADSYHRWSEDMDLLAGAGFTDYRFSIEWARIEPEPGEILSTQLEHYRRMIEGAVARGLRPFVTLHHFTTPKWFASAGGWAAPDASERFASYVRAVVPILASSVAHVCMINEPNLIVAFARSRGEDTAASLFEAHAAARDVLRESIPGVNVGWSVACRNFYPEPGAEEACTQHTYEHEGRFIEAARGDDFVGVQTYSRTRIGVRDGQTVQTGAPEGSEVTQMGWEYYPDALEDAVHAAAKIVANVPIVVTENGIATSDDALRVDYMIRALDGLRRAKADGIDIRGYFHWSLLDNYEWGTFDRTFGLIAVDRETFKRTPKPSLRWLGSIGGRHAT